MTPTRYSVTPDLPRELQVEVTGACNLRCRMCLVRYAPAVGRKEGALSYPAFRDLVDALPALTRLTLQGLGEPLLAPHLLDMIRYATQRDVEVGFNSNGVLLDRRWARDLVAAGIGWVHISLDDATAETYEDVRHSTTFAPRPGQFDQVVSNLRTLIAERTAASATRPVVKVVFVAMQRNVAELPTLVNLVADLGVDELWVQNLSHTFSDTDPAGQYAGIRQYAAEESLVNGQDTAQQAFADAAATADRRGLPIRLPRLTTPPAENAEPGQPGCAWPWESAYVTHRGEVQPCCMVMGSDRATMGRLADQPFAGTWHSQSYQDFRAGLLDGRPPEVCRGCSSYRRIF